LNHIADFLDCGNRVLVAGPTATFKQPLPDLLRLDYKSSRQLAGLQIRLERELFS